MESQGRKPSESPKPLRFVILRHVRQEDTHWDLMLELPRQDTLATWQIHLPPEQWGQHVPAVRLPDHRRIYLEYQGEISGRRGHVTRVDQGDAEILQSGQLWRILLQGQHVRGEFQLHTAPVLDPPPPSADTLGHGDKAANPL